MTVRSTSAQAHAKDGQQSKKHKIRVWIRKNGPVSRLQISDHFGYQTATVAGIITPLVAKGYVDEVGKAVCPISGNTVLMIESPVKQMRLI